MSQLQSAPCKSGPDFKQNNKEIPASRFSNTIHLSCTDDLMWKSQNEETVGKFGIFSVQRILARNSVLQKSRAFHTLQFCSWVNVIALTAENDVVMVEQFRHGVGAITLEIPGGTIEPTDESPLSAARRELLEETGYSSDDWQLIGVNHPNPALQANECYTYLARAASPVEQPRFDDTGTELTLTRLVPLGKIAGMFCDGTITHSLVMAAFFSLALSKAELCQDLLPR